MEREQSSGAKESKILPPPIKPPQPKPKTDPIITKISDLQRMNIEELNAYAKNYGLSNREHAI